LNLLTKIDAFKQHTATKKAVTLTFISTYGITENENKGMIQHEITMDDLF